MELYNTFAFLTQMSKHYGTCRDNCGPPESPQTGCIKYPVTEALIWRIEWNKAS